VGSTGKWEIREIGNHGKFEGTGKRLILGIGKLKVEEMRTFETWKKFEI